MSACAQRLCVVSKSEVSGRRHTTPQHDRGFIDGWRDGGRKNSCILEDLNKISCTQITLPKSTQHPRSTLHQFCAGGGERRGRELFAVMA